MNKILITGHNGFVGKNLIEKIKLLENIEIQTLTDHKEIFNLHLSDKKYSHIIHLAGKTSLPESWTKPHEYFVTNTESTSSCLEYCRVNNIPMTFLSTCLYTGPFDHPVNENHPICPSSPYGFSKMTCEQLCEYYIKNFNLQVTIFRPFNLFGPYQNIQFVIPHILQQLLSNLTDEIKVQTIKPKRDFIYISDLIHLILLNIQKPQSGIFNVGTGAVHSIDEVIGIAQDICKTNKKIVETGSDRKIDHPQIICDASRARDVFGWSPQIRFSEGLKFTLEYFKSIQ